MLVFNCAFNDFIPQTYPKKRTTINFKAITSVLLEASMTHLGSVQSECFNSKEEAKYENSYE